MKHSKYRNLPATLQLSEAGWNDRRNVCITDYTQQLEKYLDKYESSSVKPSRKMHGGQLHPLHLTMAGHGTYRRGQGNQDTSFRMSPKNRRSLAHAVDRVGCAREVRGYNNTKARCHTRLEYTHDSDNEKTRAYGDVSLSSSVMSWDMYTAPCWNVCDGLCRRHATKIRINTQTPT